VGNAGQYGRCSGSSHWRWLWRFVVLTLLLLDMARLRLRLAATHPDRSGGSDFWAVSDPVRGRGLRAELRGRIGGIEGDPLRRPGPLVRSSALPHVGGAGAYYICRPLTVFVPALLRLKRHCAAGVWSFACEHNRAFETKWIRREPDGRDALGTPDISSLSDLTAVVQSIRAMRVFPVGTETLVPLLIATALPWLAVVATSVPLAELFKTVVKALL